MFEVEEIYSVETLIYTVEAVMAKLLKDKFKQVKAEDIGLDCRCGSVWVSDEGLVVSKSMDGSFQYYGGGEYIDKDYRTEIGDYVFYSIEDDRVRSAVEYVIELKF